ncbi:oligosaccharide flippase family protein [Cetobacterium sp. 2A]|uniref:lipopolysaccharide biosynthesis protein n=1 Tax=Cetobacterium sp. 2A TaxID=2754723 RepID=UPI00163CCA01|nr:oligosaccharide flippase family protein [Cetobacterium sp. 2A]MBC2856169.1 oligosaccharide flippase family protein [Cetobacterium sp. 2A]
MSNYKKLGKNSLMVFLGNFGSKAIVFLMLPFYTRFLTPENYGDLDIITTIIALVTPLVTLAMSEAVFRLPKNQSKEVQGEYFTTGLVASLGGLILFGLFYVIFFKFMGNIFQEHALMVYLILMIGFLFGYLQQFTRSLDRMDIYVSTGIIYTFFFAGLNIILIKKYGFSGYLTSMLVTQILVVLYLIFRVEFRDYFNIKKFSKKRLKEILEYTIPLIPTATVWWIMNLSDRLILKYYHGGEVVGYYAVANKFPILIATIFGIFFISWQMSAIDEHAKENFEEFYNNLFKMISGILNLCNIGLILVIYPVMKILVSDNYFDSWKLVPILSLGIIYSNLASFIGVNYVAFKKTKGALYTAGFGALVNVVLNFILIPKYSVLGACIATMVAYISLFIFRKIQIDKMVYLHFEFSKMFFDIIINILIYGTVILKISLVYKIFLVTFFVSLYIYTNREYIEKTFDIIREKMVFKILKKRGENGER